jgi:calcium-dependent protein kinase
VLTFISSQMAAEKDREELMQTFKAIDKDNNGRLTREEMIQGYTKIFGATHDVEAEVERIFEQVDSNKSGEIDFSEFLVASAAEYKNVSKKKVEQTFKMFDQDGDGFIDRKELANVLGMLEMRDDEWRTMIADIDKDGDGKVTSTYEDFHSRVYGTPHNKSLSKHIMLVFAALLFSTRLILLLGIYTFTFIV